MERLRAGWAAGLPTGVVTLCLSDIEGSTALWDADPAAMADALVRHDELIADAVARHGGSFIASMGDATVSVFDSAPAAVAAALEANRALAELAFTVRWGLHTGEAERRDDYSGPTASAAARVRSYADGGQVFLSAVTAELVAGHLPDGLRAGRRRPGWRARRARPWRERAAGRVPVSRAAGLRGRRPPLLLRPRGAGGRRDPPARSPAACWPSWARRGAASPPCCARASPPPCAPARSTASRTPRCSCPAPILSSTSRTRRIACSSSTSSRSCSRCARTPTGGGRSSTACWRSRCAVVIGVRADVYARLSGHAGLARAVAANQVLLGPMSADELARAITEPARLAGLRLEPGLVELVLRDVADEPGALPLLSHALRATWDRRDGRTLTVEGYRASGGVATAIARTADAVVDALPEEQRRLARGVFLRMTELGEGIEDTRRRVAIDELVPEHADPASVDELLQRLADARLVTLDAGTAQVAHEALIREWPRLRQLARRGPRGHARAPAAGAGRAPVGDAAVASRPTCIAARAWPRRPSSAVELNATERAFLDASSLRGRPRAALPGPGQPPAARPARWRPRSCSAWRSPAACSRWASATRRGARRRPPRRSR